MRFISANIIYTITSMPIENGVIVMDDSGKIKNVLLSDEGVEKSKIEFYEGILCPGFVNAHCHLELSHLKGVITEKQGIVSFAKEIVSKRNKFSLEEKERAMHEADEMMHSNGIVAVGDISNDESSINTKIKSKTYYHTFVELIGFNPVGAKKIFEQGLELKEKYNSFKLSASLVPHAPYSVSLELMRLISNLNSFISIHNQESKEEDLFFKKGTGDFIDLYKSLNIPIDYFNPSNKSSIQTYLKHLVHINKLALVHNTFSSNEDVMYANALIPQLYWCLCPNANLYIEQSLPDVSMLMKSNCKMIIGTDSLASNHQLSIVDEINCLRNKFPNIETQELLKWATYNGASFLGIEDKYGSIEKEKSPGLILLNEKNKSFQLKKAL